jgi:hypothetical protein
LFLWGKRQNLTASERCQVLRVAGLGLVVPVLGNIFPMARTGFEFTNIEAVLTDFHQNHAPAVPMAPDVARLVQPADPPLEPTSLLCHSNFPLQVKFQAQLLEKVYLKTTYKALKM